MVDDLKMELHTANQAKEDLAKQVKQGQVLLLLPPAGPVRVQEGRVDKKTFRCTWNERGRNL